MSENKQVLRVAKRATGPITRTNEATGEKYKMHFYYVLPSSNKLAVEQYKQDSLDAGHQPIFDDGEGDLSTGTGLQLLRTSQFVPAGCDMKRIIVTDKATGAKKPVWTKSDELWVEINEAKKAGYDSDAEDLIVQRDKLANARKAEIAKIIATVTVGESGAVNDADDDIDPFA